MCLVCHQLRLHTWVAYIWPSFVMLSLACLTACYIYQFEDIQQWLQTVTSPAVLQDIGLVVNPPPQLFAYLMQVGRTRVWANSLFTNRTLDLQP